MSEFILMIRNVLLFVAMAIPGFILVKTKLMEEKFSGILSKILTYLGMPFLILSSTLDVSFSGEFTLKIILVGVVGALFTVALFFLSALLVKKEDEEKKKGMVRFCATFSNNGFLGIPLAKAVFGKSPIVTYAIVLNIITNVLMFTLGVYLISGDKKSISVRKVVLNPLLISFAVGIVLNLTKATEYVSEIASFSTFFSNIVTPLSMTVLGMKMAGVKFSALFTNASLYYVSATKLILAPVLIVGIALALRLAFYVDNQIICGLFVAFAMPTASLSSAFADRYNGDGESAVAFTLGSTIASVVTIPILYWLLCLVI